MDPHATTLSFRWLFAQTSLNITELHPASIPEFSTVQISELEDASEFIVSGAVVLTIGATFKNREADLPAYIERLVDAGAVAIGFGIGSPFDHVPEQVISTAAHRGVGVFAIPPEVSFLSVVTAVNNEQQRRIQRAHNQLLAAQGALTDIAARSTHGNVDKLLAHAATALSARVTVIDSAYPNTPIATAGASNLGTSKTFFTSYVFPVLGKPEHSIKVTAAAQISPQSRSLIRHCAGLVALLLARPAKLHSARQELNTLALSLQLTHPGELPASFDFPTDSSGRTCPVVVATTSSRVLRSAFNSLDANAHHFDLELFTICFDDLAMTFLLPADEDPSAIAKLLGPARRNVRVMVGSPTELSALTMDHVVALRKRADSFQLGQVMFESKPRYTWLTDPTLVASMAARYDELFGALPETEPELFAALSCFLEADSKHNKVADQLQIHRHTARARVEKAADLCDLDLSDPTARAEAIMALTAKEHINLLCRK